MFGLVWAAFDFMGETCPIGSAVSLAQTGYIPDTLDWAHP